jgi:high-affinity K+ transport system ATPase subunit B
MTELISDFEEKLKVQLADLATQIKSQESQILVLKEGYLKVQGALELIDAIKKGMEDRKDE